ncbi:MAG: ABC transporter ATP-binding protein [Sedimentisphaerales bacterium]|nr:ABC transporter ATP-binding protein [Sedimentisphaerales bacterium]
MAQSATEIESTKSLFELRGVIKRFGRVQALTDIHLHLERGKTTVIIGPSGCGKTVLLKHLIVLIRPDRGEVYFDRVRIDNLPESRLTAMRRRCGFLFQAGALFDSETAAQNVAFPLVQHTDYPAEQIDRIVQDKLAIVGLAGFGDRLPSELSGGQIKRVALARAIALSPEVILYDEPTTGLDPIRAEVINDLIIKLQRELKITSIVVTHDLHSAYKVGDRIVMLSHGRIVADGTPSQIRQSQQDEVQYFLQGRSDGLDGDLL